MLGDCVLKSYYKDKKIYIESLGINILIGILIYIILISQQLTNHYDGLWADSVYIADLWELSIGRWFWPVLDRLRVGYAADPFNSYLTIFFIALGNLLIVDVFSMVGEKKAYIINAMIFSSTTVSVFLSYRYMSPTFGLSYLFSIASAWIIYKKSTWKDWLFASGLICLSLGLYQANLGCFCLLAYAMALFLCCEENDNKKILLFLVKVGTSIILACIFYKIIWNLMLKIFHIAVASYKGAENVSIFFIIKKLPGQILDAYAKFYIYFLKNEFKHSVFQYIYVYVLIFLFLLLALLWKAYMLLQKKKWLKLIIYLSGVVTLPIACNICVLLAPEAGFMLQQTCAMAITFPIMFCLVCTLFRNLKNYCWIKKITIGIAIFILYGNIYMVAIDLEAMYEGKNTSENIMNYVIHTLIDKNLYDSEKQYFFLGQISSNPMFRTTEIWGRANLYARYGEFWQDLPTMRVSYQGLLQDIGIKLTIGDLDKYQDICTDQVNNMPVFPKDGSILNMDEYVIIKISNTYSK